jgi:hypothetical protein
MVEGFILCCKDDQRSVGDSVYFASFQGCDEVPVDDYDASLDETGENGQLRSERVRSEVKDEHKAHDNQARDGQPPSAALLRGKQTKNARHTNRGRVNGFSPVCVWRYEDAGQQQSTHSP